ncbi:hypothetical protein VB780_13295 [Leptolyngbya sp. CCNP1308]|uniref:hypothetical protein n=1 Tax=Leptolyngbya sp. CCNP1308 TaxID=3110255 RepID=UPI002B1ED2DC|nr:hypothetical protein [Leptolyngbya sp. CCNP1308]MEA5449554.1 hypothetical protein [Leptolyngbya sp. CCNP1308]
MDYKKYLHSKHIYLEKYGWGHIRPVQRFLKRLLSTEELSIRQGRDGLKTGLEGHRNSNKLFFVQDRTTSQHHIFLSETDLRIWLDQRYYRHTCPPDLDWTYHRQRWLR